jgi:hypothetical protein
MSTKLKKAEAGLRKAFSGIYPKLQNFECLSIASKARKSKINQWCSNMGHQFPQTLHGAYNGGPLALRHRSRNRVPLFAWAFFDCLAHLLLRYGATHDEERFTPCHSSFAKPARFHIDCSANHSAWNRDQHSNFQYC